MLSYLGKGWEPLVCTDECSHNYCLGRVFSKHTLILGLAKTLMVFSASLKISHLEYACKKRDDAMKEQQTQENKFCKQAKQVKERKAGWQKRKKDLEQHYSALTGEVHAREQVQ